MPTVNGQQKRVDKASELAGYCLSYLAENSDELLAFMNAAGLDPQSLRSAVGSHQLDSGLIDYVAQNESLLLAVCSGAAITPEAFMRVWHQLNPSG